MEWIEPVSHKSTVKFSSPVVNLLHEESPKIRHGSFPEAQIAWFATADKLDIVSTTHSGVQSRQFHCPQGQDFEVTCVAVIPNEPLALVGLSSSTGSGAVALYNYSTSLILNSWSISHRVTCLCTMEVPNVSYKQFLKTDCFLFALGTEEGHVMLMAIDQHFKFAEGTHQLDLNIVHYYTIDDILHQRTFFKPPVVMVIPLNDHMYRAGKFVLESMHESQAVLSAKQEDITATVVKYIPQTQSLCVGYNKQGAFQMFSLKTLESDFNGFASGCNAEMLDEILDFAFLEPEDDPRHYCYLVVVASKQNGSHYSPFALLYSLTYVQKDTASDGGILYEELQYITLRLDINFGPLITSVESENGVDNVEFLAIRSLSSSFTSPVNVNSTRAVPCNGVCYFAMQSSTSVFVTIFDLNQWYQAQMPSRWIFDDLSTVCPFVGFYRIHVQGTAVRQVWIEPDTLSIFHRSSITPNEAFFYPSALSFRAAAISPFEADSILFLGLQSLLLHKLSRGGSQVLNQPQRYYIQAVKAGLAPAEVVAPTVFQMAEALLNIGLENNSRAFLISCIKDEGANLNFVEKWAWQQVVSLKTLRENLCQMLFDHSAQEVEQQTHTQLYHVTHQFNNLAVLYDVMDKKIRSLNSGVNDKLREKARAIHLLSLHLETVLWFLHGGLLPEVDEGEGETSSLPFPRHQMELFYRSRKREIEALSSSVKAQEVLLIEQLVPKSVSDLWAEERGSNELTYPPPSLYALLSAYLRPDVDDVTKHRIVQYVFMDLTWIYEQHEHFGNVLQHLVTFPSTYSLKPSTIKVTQAFWHLDHQNFDDALGVLLDPLVHSSDITNVQQRAILRAFLYQDQRRHALKYATLRHPVCPELEDIQLHLTILIANNLISDALNYIRRNRNQKNSTELMQHLMSGCHEMRKFSVLLTLPLTDEEEEHVTSYLKRSRNLDLQEALLLFYIQRCKYPDAIAYSQRLNQMWPARDATSRERYNRREMLMQTLIGALPPITCKLASIVNSKPTGTLGSSKHPKPLSIAVLPASSKVQSQGSNFFRTVIEQSRATWLIEQKMHEEVQSPLKSRKRKLEVPEELAMEPETTPFLCNIVQPTKRNVTLGMSLAFPSPKVADASSMDITEIDHDITQPKQSKRPRYSLFPKPKAVKADSEVSSILHTPPVRRSRPFLAAGEAPGSCNRPSSILKDKMKRFMNFSTFESNNQASSADGQPSESEADMEVSMLEISSAKHLRFALPRTLSMEQASPEQAPAQNNDVTMSDDGQKSQVAEDSQFLSFEDSEKEDEPVPTKETLPTETPSVPDQTNEPEPAHDTSDDQMELTTMIPVVIESTRKSVTVYVEEQQITDDEEHVTKTTVRVSREETKLSEVAEVSDESDIADKEETEAGDFVGLAQQAVDETEKAAGVGGLADELVDESEPAQPAVQSSDDESDIVCLDSDSDEGPAQQAETEEAYYDDEQEEEEEEEEEEVVVYPVEEEEDADEEEEGAADAEEDEAVETDENVEDEERDEDAVQSVTAHQYVRPDDECEQSVSSAAAPSGSVVELVSDEDRDLLSVAESVRESDQRSAWCQTVDMSTSESALRDVNQQPEDLADDQGSVVEERSVEDYDSDEPESVEGDEIYSTTTTTESKSMSVTKHRFALSSSEDSSSSEGVLERERELAEFAKRRHCDVSGYSAVEPDLVESDSNRSASPPHAEPEGDEAEEKPEMDVSGYSPVESDLEESDQSDVMDVDEQDSPVKPGRLADESIVLERSVPLASAIADAAQEASEEQECEDEEGDEENFELRFSDTPNVTRRSSRFLKRFSLGSAADSDDEEQERQEVQEAEQGGTERNEEDQQQELALEQSSIQDQQEQQRQQLLIEPEESPMKPAQVEDSDSGDDSIANMTSTRFVAVRSTRSSMFRTRLQLTDSESSEDEEAADAPAADVPAAEEDKAESSGEQPGSAERVEPIEMADQERDEQAEQPEQPEQPQSVEEDGDQKVGELTEEVEQVEPIEEDGQNDDGEQADGVEEPVEVAENEPEKEPEIAEAAEDVVPPEELSGSETTEKLPDDASVRSDGSSTMENENLKEILERHERFDVPLIPDAGVLITDRDLSTIVEERTFDQSVAPGLNQTERATLESLEEEPESAAPENLVAAESAETQVPEVPTAEQAADVDSAMDSQSASNVNTLDAAMMNEDVAEPSTLTDNDEEEEKQRAEDVKVRGRTARSKSLRLSQVPLPFTSRKSVWDASSRERSPDSATSEPPQTIEDSAAESTRTRRRRHSASLSSAPVPTRRSARLSIQPSAEGMGTPVKEEPATPPKAGRKSQLAGEKDADDAFVPPSLDVSPADSSYSGRSSLVGTPVRRSARLALRDRTPEPTAASDILMASLTRIRRHSTGPGDVASPARRSGRKSLNVSRDNSPESITSEPPPRTETTPSRRPKSTRGLRSAQKAAVHNLFPVEEEAEALNDVASVSVSVRDSDDSVSIDDAESMADTSITSVSSVTKRTRKPRGQPTSRPSSAASSVTSSPGGASTRYNLRRGRRASELDIVPEEDQSRSTASHEQTAELAVKRIRETAPEGSSPERAGPASQEETDESESTKRSTRPKRRKKAAEQEEPAEEIHFAPASRPPPKNLPKREPVIKSRSSIRRSMKLDK